MSGDTEVSTSETHWHPLDEDKVEVLVEQGPGLERVGQGMEAEPYRTSGCFWGCRLADMEEKVPCTDPPPESALKPLSRAFHSLNPAETQLRGTLRTAACGDQSHRAERECVGNGSTRKQAPRGLMDQPNPRVPHVGLPRPRNAEGRLSFRTAVSSRRTRLACHPSLHPRPPDEGLDIVRAQQLSQGEKK